MKKKMFTLWMMGFFLLLTTMVVGRWIVSCGVRSAGVLGPNAAIELGKNTAQPVVLKN